MLIGDTELGGLDDKRLTLLRRTQIGFVFQSFNLVPTLTAEENILLPLSIAGRKPDPAWYDAVIDTVNLGTGSATVPTSSPAASSSGSPSRVRWPAGPRSCSPTSRPGTWTPAPVPRC